MATTPRMALIEALRGKPMQEILVDLYAEHRNIERVAEALGITYQALWIWMKFLGITTNDLRWAVRERDGQGVANREQ